MRFFAIKRWDGSHITDDKSSYVASEDLGAAHEGGVFPHRQPHSRQSVSQGPNHLLRSVKNITRFGHLELTTISKDNTAAESLRTSASFAYFGSKLTSRIFKSSQKTSPQRTENKISTTLSIQEEDDLRGRSYLCTYDGCERGIPGNGFPRSWDLRDHLQRIHNHVVELQGNSTAPDRYINSVFEKEQSETSEIVGETRRFPSHKSRPPSQQLSQLIYSQIMTEQSIPNPGWHLAVGLNMRMGHVMNIVTNAFLAMPHADSNQIITEGLQYERKTYAMCLDKASYEATIQDRVHDLYKKRQENSMLRTQGPSEPWLTASSPHPLEQPNNDFVHYLGGRHHDPVWDSKSTLPKPSVFSGSPEPSASALGASRPNIAKRARFDIGTIGPSSEGHGDPKPKRIRVDS